MRDGGSQVNLSSGAQPVLDRHRIVGQTLPPRCKETVIPATLWAEPGSISVPWFGKALYHLLPYRRAVVLGNLRRVFGDVLSEVEICELAQACYAHYVRFVLELVRLPLLTAKQRKALIRIENLGSLLRAQALGKG